MDKSNEIIDPRFDRFIHDEMTAENRNSFVSELENNKELRESFDLHHDAVIAIQSHNEDLLRKKIKNVISVDGAGKTRRKTLIRRLSFLAAASFLLIIGTNLFLESSRQTYNLNDTYSSIIELELDKTSRAGFANTNQKKSLNKALSALNENMELDKSSSTLIEVLNEEEKEKISILEDLKEVILGESKKNIDSKKVKFTENQELYELAVNLAKLKQKNTKKQAIIYFEILSQDENSEYAHIAKELITYD